MWWAEGPSLSQMPTHQSVPAAANAGALQPHLCPGQSMPHLFFI